MIRRLEAAALKDSAVHPTDRYQMPMSTLLSGEEWLLETDWNGRTIGDIQVFRNANAREGRALLDGDKQPLPAVWTWWGSVPCAMVKTYRFLEPIEPQSVKDAERKAQSGPTVRKGEVLPPSIDAG